MVGKSERNTRGNEGTIGADALVPWLTAECKMNKIQKR